MEPQRRHHKATSGKDALALGGGGRNGEDNFGDPSEMGELSLVELPKAQDISISAWIGACLVPFHLLLQFREGPNIGSLGVVEQL